MKKLLSVFTVVLALFCCTDGVWAQKVSWFNDEDPDIPEKAVPGRTAELKNYYLSVGVKNWSVDMDYTDDYKYYLTLYKGDVKIEAATRVTGGYINIFGYLGENAVADAGQYKAVVQVCEVTYNGDDYEHPVFKAVVEAVESMEWEFTVLAPADAPLLDYKQSSFRVENPDADDAYVMFYNETPHFELNFDLETQLGSKFMIVYKVADINKKENYMEYTDTVRKAEDLHIVLPENWKDLRVEREGDGTGGRVSKNNTTDNGYTVQLLLYRKMDYGWVNITPAALARPFVFAQLTGGPSLIDLNDFEKETKPYGTVKTAVYNSDDAVYGIEAPGIKNGYFGKMYGNTQLEVILYNAENKVIMTDTVAPVAEIPLLGLDGMPAGNYLVQLNLMRVNMDGSPSYWRREGLGIHHFVKVRVGAYEGKPEPEVPQVRELGYPYDLAAEVSSEKQGEVTLKWSMPEGTVDCDFVVYNAMGVAVDGGLQKAEEGRVEVKIERLDTGVYTWAVRSVVLDGEGQVTEAGEWENGSAFKVVAVAGEDDRQPTGDDDEKEDDNGNGNNTAVEADVLPGVKVYPNPSSGVFYVSVPLPAFVEVIGLNGAVLARETVQGVRQFNIARSGLYFVRASSGSRTSVSRIIVR